MKIDFDVIEGPSLLNKFMRAADVFSDSKQLAKHSIATITYNGEPDYAKLTQLVVDGFEHSGRNVVFVGCRQFDCLAAPFLKEGVSVISDGTHWGLFSVLLQSLGYTVETNEFRKVTKAQLTNYSFDELPLEMQIDILRKEHGK